MNLYFNEYNLLMGSGGVTYLPLVSGILSAYIKTDQLVSKKIKVMPFIFEMTSSDKILNQYTERPDIAVFSISMWNEQLSLEVANEIKTKYPSCLIVFGGPQCPHNPTEFMTKHTFIDIAVRAEGEEAFLGILKKFILNTGEFSSVPNVSWRSASSIVINKETPRYERSLDVYPSPYLTGEFDYLLTENHKFQAIVETNRGCPFLCTFCYWGRGGNNTKYRFKDLQVVFDELEYLAKNKVEYIFNADSNFGMHRRDYDIALKLVELKEKYGYPEKFRTCWGKNTSERIFKIATLLQYYDLDKGVTLARQSNNNEVLSNIKRANIKLSAYEYLESNFNKLNVPIYGELILGLPGETHESWVKGIDEMLERGINNQLFVYQAEIYPNTELGDPEYQEKYGIETTKIKLHEIHCAPRGSNWVSEYQEIVTKSHSMSNDDWKYMTVYSHLMMLFHGMKVAFYIIYYLNKHCSVKYSEIFKTVEAAPNDSFIGEIISDFYNYANNILKGNGRGIYVEKYSDVYLEPEEVALVKISENKDKFFDELMSLLLPFVSQSQSHFFKELIIFSKALIPSYSESGETLFEFGNNISKFSYGIYYSTEEIQPSADKEKIKVIRKNFNSLHEFVRTKIIWARKSGRILWETDVEIKLKENSRVSFDVHNFASEKSFNIDLFDSRNESFEKYLAFDPKSSNV